MSWANMKGIYLGVCDRCGTNTQLRFCIRCSDYVCEDCSENGIFCTSCNDFICSDCDPLTCSICERKFCKGCMNSCSEESIPICSSCLLECETCQTADCGCLLLECEICGNVFCEKCHRQHFISHYYPNLLLLAWTHCSTTVLNTFQHALFNELEDYCTTVSHRK